MRKALKFFLKTLKVLTLSVAIILFLFIIALGVFLKWPEFILNEKNLKRAAPFAAELGILIHWDKLHFELDSISFFNKRFSFEFEGLCIYQDAIQACFPQVNFTTHVHWDKGIQINEVGPVYIKDARLFYYMKQEKEEKKSDNVNKNPFEFNSPQIVLPDFLQKTKFKDLSIHFKKIYIIEEERIQKFSLDLQGKHNDKFQLQSIQVNLNALQTPWLEKGKLELDLTSSSHFLTNQWNLKINLDLTRKGGQQIIAKGQVRPKEQNLMSFDISGKGSFEKTSTDIALNGQLGKGELHLNTTGTLIGGLEPIRSLSLNKCRLDLKPSPPNWKQSQLNLDCPIQASIDKIEIPQDPLSLKKHIHIPTQINLNAKLDATIPMKDFQSSLNSGVLKLDFDSISQELLKTEGNIQVEFAGQFNQKFDQWKTDTDLDVTIQLYELKRLINLLRKTPYEAWAPLHVLQGPAELKLKGKLNLKEKKGDVPIQFRTGFYSDKQKIYSEGKGKLNFDFSKKLGDLDLKLSLLLDQLQLALPTLYLEPLPNFFPDSRFQQTEKEKQEKEKPAHFNYEIEIKTKQDAILLSNLAKNGKIPISLDIKVKPEGIKGDLTLNKTPVEVFKRVAQIDRVAIELFDPLEKSRLNGLIKVEYAAYNIEIALVGNLERPRLLFSSQPPLAKEDIISILIYGRQFEELNQSESGSVNNVAAATFERSMGLGTMYLLASTPIESVVYNPATKQFSARFKVAKGTSLDVGTKEGKTQNLKLRKNLGGNWIINTYIENDSESGKQRGGAGIEWSKRY